VAFTDCLHSGAIRAISLRFGHFDPETGKRREANASQVLGQDPDRLDKTLCFLSPKQVAI